MKQQRDLPEDMGEGIGNHTQAEIGSEDALTGEARSDIEAQSRYDAPQEQGNLAEGLEEDAITGVGEGAVAEESVGEGLEGVGAVLDATGVLAPFGALVGGAGVALDIAGLYQVGKGVGEWFEEDILQKPMPSAPQIQLPSQPFTISQRGMGIAVSYTHLTLPTILRV